MKKYNRICGLHNGLELFIIALIILTRKSLAGPTLALQVVGFSIAGIGLFVMIYAGLLLLRASRRKPDEGETLIEQGPYRIVRHPYYLGAIILYFGLAIGLRSLWGLIATVVLLIPSAIYVGRLEDAMLEQKFGQDWRRYADRTYSMFPPAY